MRFAGHRNKGALPPMDPATGLRPFIWSDESEPHMFRRKELMKKYGPEIRKLMKHEPITKYYCLAIVAINLTLSVIAKDFSWPAYLFAAWVAGIVTHSAFLAVHEVTHHLAFRSMFLNDLLAMAVNFVITVPYAQMFKNYHAEHHKYQGWDGVDTDIPSDFELRVFQSFPGKIFFATFQIFFYALRPGLLRAPKLNWRHLLNWVVVLAFDAFWAWLWGYEALVFLLVAVVLAGSWNPVSGHFISEHYVFDPNAKQETYSYYGPWNAISFNVGYHNEHHDFPNLPWTALPKLRALAPEFYEPLCETKSWFFTALNFVLDDNVGVWARVKREKGAGKRAQLIPTTRDVKADEFVEISKAGALGSDIA